jgi:hypothetical protein
MTDRELLELAAKAAGRGSQWWMESTWNGPDKEWNPLTDDGDALRLAVKLELDVFHSHLSVRAVRRGSDELTAIRCTGAFAKMNREEATRRAIVRAAAEIGRSKT